MARQRLNGGDRLRMFQTVDYLFVATDESRASSASERRGRALRSTACAGLRRRSAANTGCQAGTANVERGTEACVREDSKAETPIPICKIHRHHQHSQHTIYQFACLVLVSGLFTARGQQSQRFFGARLSLDIFRRLGYSIVSRSHLSLLRPASRGATADQRSSPRRGP